jgi:hypothetical protein
MTTEFILSLGAESSDDPITLLDAIPLPIQKCLHSWGCDLRYGQSKSQSKRIYIVCKDGWEMHELACMSLDSGCAFWIQPSRFHSDETVFELHNFRSIEV